MIKFLQKYNSSYDIFITLIILRMSLHGRYFGEEATNQQLYGFKEKTRGRFLKNPKSHQLMGMSLSEQIENTVDKILDDCIDFEKNMETSTYRGRIVRFLWEENNIDMYERFQDSTKTQLLEYKPMISDEIKLEIWFILTWIGYDLENGK